MFKMEILKRKIEAKREENQEEMSVSLIDGIRLSCRWHKRKGQLPTQENIKKAKSFADLKEKENNEDMLINFTKEETEKIFRLRRRDC